MTWIRFTADHDHRPRYGVVIAYKAGWTGNVPHAAADEAVAAGRAVRLRKARKGEEPVEVEDGGGVGFSRIGG